VRLVFITQKVDRDDPILGAAVAKIAALAARCDEVVVLCGAVGGHDLPAHVSFRTFAAPTRFRRGSRFVAALISVLLRRRAHALVAHSVPIYLVLAAPLAKPLRVPLLLWYAHWAADRTLRLADRLCDAALSVDRSSYPLASRKLRAIGHGIDVGEFGPRDGAVESDGGRLRLLALGRTSPTKGFVVLLDAFERALREGFEGSLEIRGPSTTDAERRHRGELARRIAESPLRGHVSLAEPVARTAVPDLLRRFDAVVNTHGGTLDKVVYEAAACAVPVVASSPQWNGFLGDLPVELRFRGADTEDLARTLLALGRTGAQARAEAGRELRRRVERSHSVDTWAERVLAVVRELRQPS
jgi:glycosyltransferase involved in cell wall biosynthesis